MKALWDKLSSYNEALTFICGRFKKIYEPKEKDNMIQFLIGLNDTYSAVHEKNLLMQPLNHNNTNSYVMNVTHNN